MLLCVHATTLLAGYILNWIKCGLVLEKVAVSTLHWFKNVDNSVFDVFPEVHL